MKRRLSWYLGWRYFIQRKGNRYISWVSTISIGGITVGMIALIMTTAILNGFEGEVTKRIIRFIPHVIIRGDLTDNQWIKEDERVLESYASMERKAILETHGSQVVAQVQALDIDKWERLRTDNPTTLLGSGRLGIEEEGQLPGLVLGSGLSDKLMVSVGDTIRVTSPLDTRKGLLRIPQRHFVITGVFRSDLFDYDRTIAMIEYREGRRLFKRGGEPEQQIRLIDYRDADAFRQELIARHGNLHVETWYEQHKTLFDAMRLEKWGSFVGLNLIILVAVFNIVSTLIMLVLEKTAEIGILRVLGLNRDQIRRTFMIQGFLVAVLGVFLGTLIGSVLYLSQKAWAWLKLPSDIYLIPEVPMILSIWELLLIASTAFLIVMLSVRYPARRAADLVPIEAIHYKK